MNYKTTFKEETDKYGNTKLVEVKVSTDTITLQERARIHKLNHPNDKGIKRNKHVTWSKKTEKDKKLDLFYKQHIYTFTDETDLSKRAWIRISGFKGEEE